MWAFIFGALMIGSVLGVLYLTGRFAKFQAVKRLAKGKRWAAFLIGLIPVLTIALGTGVALGRINTAISLLHLMAFWLLCDGDRRACGEEAGKAVYQILSYAMMNLLVNTGLFCPLGVLFCIFLIPRKGYYGVMVTEPMTWVACGLFLTVVYFVSKNRRVDLPGGSDEKILRERGE